MLKKLVMILIMAMVAFGSFAKSFEYKAADEQWTYYDETRDLHLNYKTSYGTEYDVFYFDVSEAEAWKIINNEEFPTFEIYRFEVNKYASIYKIPARDYRNGR